MNIGLFTDAYYPQINGVVISTRILKKELEKLGHNVTIITVSDPNIINDEKNVLRLPSIPFWKIPNFRIGAFYSPKVMREIKKLNLDIIHTQTEFSIGIFARIIAKTLDIPIVHTYHTMYEDYTHYIVPKKIEKHARTVAKKASKLICDSVDQVIVPTDKVKNKLEDYGLNKSINIIPTGIDLRPFEKESYMQKDIIDLKLKLKIPINKKIILYIGRIAKEKNIDIIIKSFNKILQKQTDSILLIVGGGPELNNLKKLANEENIDNYVFFTGEVPWENIGEYYQLGDVFVSASTSETQGLTFVEAMASMLPVVAKYDTNLDGVLEDNINGKFFRSDEELSNAIIEILNNEELAKKLCANAYRMIEHLSSSYFGERVEDVYFKTLSQKQIYKHTRRHLKILKVIKKGIQI